MRNQNQGQSNPNQDVRDSLIPRELTRTRSQAIVRRMQWLASVLDDRFRIPGTNYWFGLDGILGLIPVVGDISTGLISLYLAFEAWRLGMPKRTLLRMGINLMLDVLVGSIPLLGDFFDFSWKANKKNVQLVLRHLERDC